MNDGGYFNFFLRSGLPNIPLQIFHIKTIQADLQFCDSCSYNKMFQNIRAVKGPTNPLDPTEITVGSNVLWRAFTV